LAALAVSEKCCADSGIETIEPFRKPGIVQPLVWDLSPDPGVRNPPTRRSGCFNVVNRIQDFATQSVDNYIFRPAERYANATFRHNMPPLVSIFQGFGNRLFWLR
jgi:hypothetical protein